MSTKTYCADDIADLNAVLDAEHEAALAADFAAANDEIVIAYPGCDEDTAAAAGCMTADEVAQHQAGDAAAAVDCEDWA